MAVPKIEREGFEMAKWEVDGFTLFKDGNPIVEASLSDPDSGLNEIARKLNAFDEMQQTLIGPTGALAMCQGAMEIQDYSAVRGLLGTMNDRVEAAVKVAKEGE